MIPRLSSPAKYNFARGMRRTPTVSENALWQLIRRKQLGMKFRRQFVLLGYIVDFYQLDTKLAIEVDGGSHISRNEEDTLRDKNLAAYGVTTLRVTDVMVLAHPDFVVDLITNKLRDRLVATAFERGNDPAKYFTSLIKKEMR